MSATEPTKRPLLLHSLAEFREILLACLDAAGARRVCEIGGEGGQLTRALADWAAEHGGEVVCVEPAPSSDLRALASEGRVAIVEGLSPAALDQVGPCDAWVIDGDHNYWTVANELEWIRAHHDAPPLVLFHDVAWPAAHRDQYYDPAAIPAEGVREHSYDGRARPGRSALGEDGFYGAGAFAYATEEGGAENGVLTAVEDHVERHGDLRLFRLPCVFGFGVLVPQAAAWADDVARVVEALDELPLLARLEENRIALYLEVLALNQRMAEQRRSHDTVLARLHREVAAAESELAKLRREAALAVS